MYLFYKKLLNRTIIGIFDCTVLIFVFYLWKQEKKITNKNNNKINIKWLKKMKWIAYTFKYETNSTSS